MQGIAVPGSLRFGKSSRPPHKETPCPTIITSASNAAPPCAARTFTAGGNPRRTAPSAANAAPSLPTNSPFRPNGTNTPGGSCRRLCSNTGKSAALSLTAARTNGWRLWSANFTRGTPSSTAPKPKTSATPSAAKPPAACRPWPILRKR